MTIVQEKQIIESKYNKLHTNNVNVSSSSMTSVK